VVAVLLAISLLGVAFYYFETSGLTSTGQAAGIATVSTTGIPCGSESLTQAVQAAMRDPNFTALSNGRCYNFLGQPGSAGDNRSILTFVHYNGTITYPCGTSPEQLPDSEIQVVVTVSGNLVSARLVAPSGSHQPGACDLSIPVRVVAVDDVESTIPAVPQLNLTLASAAGARPITALRAVFPVLPVQEHRTGQPLRVWPSHIHHGDRPLWRLVHLQRGIPPDDLGDVRQRAVLQLHRARPGRPRAVTHSTM
jgi:hypothetical protein